MAARTRAEEHHPCSSDGGVRSSCLSKPSARVWPHFCAETKRIVLLERNNRHLLFHNPQDDIPFRIPVRTQVLRNHRHQDCPSRSLPGSMQSGETERMSGSLRQASQNGCHLARVFFANSMAIMIASEEQPYRVIRNRSCPSDTAKDPDGGNTHASTSRDIKYITAAGRHDHRVVVNAIPIRNRSMKRGGSVSKTKIAIQATITEYETAKKYGTLEGFIG